MAEQRILIVGAGPAGLSAAVSLAEAGQDTVVVDHMPTIGGAVYAQNRTGGEWPQSHGFERRALFEAVEAQKPRIDIRCATAFVGLDYQGNALLAGSCGLLFQPRAVIMATGARELVRPRPGWTLPGVTTVGALQVALKNTGRAPKGLIAIAGTGPLLYALGAQLARAGNAPVAVFETARPFHHPRAALRLPLPVLREAAGYMATLIRARVPIVTSARVQSIFQDADGLRLETTQRGRFATLMVDHLGLHDGLARNDYGLPDHPIVPVTAAGDCRDVLGRFAAVKDGARAAAEVLARLGLDVTARPVPSLTPEKAALERLETLFACDDDIDLNTLPDDTILCRCENRTLGDFNALRQTERTARMLRLNGRFGMGACQGRFCLDWVANLAGDAAERVRGRRWPVRPISVQDILEAADDSGHAIPITSETTT